MVCVPGVALSDTVSDPDALPARVGLKVILIEQLCPEVRLAGQELVNANGPVMVMLLMVSVAAPVLVRLAAMALLVEPTLTLPKLMLAGFRLAAAPDDVGLPVPLRATVCGLPPPVSAIDSEALRAPCVPGVNVTVNVQLAPASTLFPQVVLSLKSVVLLPVNVTELMLTAFVPTLVKETVCGGLVCPRLTLPKFRLVGDRLTAVPVPERETV